MRYGVLSGSVATLLCYAVRSGYPTGFVMFRIPRARALNDTGGKVVDEILLSIY